MEKGFLVTSITYGCIDFNWFYTEGEAREYIRLNKLDVCDFIEVISAREIMEESEDV